ncbi:MAG: phage portal protein [Hydrogenoanaerobacterium sp.]
MAVSTVIPHALAEKPNATALDAERWIKANAKWVDDTINTHNAWIKDTGVEKYQAAYDGELEEIECREKARSDGANYKLIANYASIIVDTIVDYMVGKPPIYTVEDPEQDDDDTVEAEIVTEYRKKLTALLKDKAVLTLAEMLRQGCIAGYSAVIAWVDEMGKIDYNEYPIQEVVPVFDVRGRLSMVLRVYSVEGLEEGQTVTKKRVEIYDKRYISYYISDGGTSFIVDQTEVATGNPIEHKAGRIPVAIYQNGVPAKYTQRIKSNGKSDLSFGVFDLIVAYSHGISDKANLVEYLQDMYLLLTGVDVDEKEVLKMRKARAIALKDANSKAGFIAQDQADGAVENFLTRLSKDIYDTTGTPRLSELNGATATEIKMKYVCLDIKAGKKEPRFVMAIKDLVAILTDFLNTQKLVEEGAENTYDTITNEALVEKRTDLYKADWVSISLVRNLPQNYKEIADIVAELADTVPDAYLYELLWFIEDPQKVVEEMKAQKTAESLDNANSLGLGTANMGDPNDTIPPGV